MSKQSGIIYDLGNERYGLAINSEQVKAFSQFNRVFLHVFLDSECTRPELDPQTGKKYVTLKHISKIKQISFFRLTCQNHTRKDIQIIIVLRPDVLKEG